MKTWHHKRLAFVFFRLCEHTAFDGFDIGICVGSQSQNALVRRKVIDALALIRKVDPRRYRYMQRDVKRILLLGNPFYRGQWVDALGLCHLTYDYILAPDTTPEMVAAILIHEAMHARLYRWGIDYEEPKRARIEQICLKAEIAFARRLPLTEKVARKQIMSTARQLMDWKPERWTDLGALEYHLQTLERAKMHPLVVAVLRRRILAEIRRLTEARETD